MQHALLLFALISLFDHAVAPGGRGGGGGGGGGRGGGGGFGRGGGGGRGAGAAGARPVVTPHITTTRSSTFIFWHHSYYPGYASERGPPAACVQSQPLAACPGCSVSLWLGQSCYIYEEQRDCIERVMHSEPPKPDRGALHQAGLKLSGGGGATLQSEMTSHAWELHYSCNTASQVNCTQRDIELATRLQKLTECERQAQAVALANAYFLHIFLSILGAVLVVAGITMFVLYVRQRRLEQEGDACCGEQQPLLQRVQ